MASPRPPSLAKAHHYRLPELLHDIRLLDLLELCGTTVQTSRLLQLSQPTISRRYRLLSEDFGLVRDRRQLWGCGYGTSAAMRLLRLWQPKHWPLPMSREIAGWREGGSTAPVSLRAA